MRDRQNQQYCGEGANDLQYIADQLERLRRRIDLEGSPSNSGKSLVIQCSELGQIARRLNDLGCYDLARRIEDYGSVSRGERTTMFASTGALGAFLNTLLRSYGVSPNIEPEPELAPEPPRRKPAPVYQEVYGDHYDRNGFRIYGHPRDHFRPDRHREQVVTTTMR